MVLDSIIFSCSPTQMTCKGDSKQITSNYTREAIHKV